MAKVKTTFYCQNCGAQHSKWQGQCNFCKSWNTVIEEVIQSPKKGDWKTLSDNKRSEFPKPLKISDIDTTSSPRLDTKDDELNRVLGGGIVPGSLILLGGEPGIGKSTLMLQISLLLPFKTLYVSGEESQKQIKLRAQRISPDNNNCYVLTETNTQQIFKQIELLEPDVLVIDSIQTLQSDFLEASAGSISQIKQSTTELMKFAKETSIPVILIGHITKDGTIAGPKILEHMVDTVLQFEGDRNYNFRILRANKNRFGSTREIGIYEMLSDGLKQVHDPSDVLISKNDRSLSGNAIAVMLEGMRPFLVEVQALVSTAVYGTPQRSTTGFNGKRLNMLLAVLEKRAGFRLGAKDVFLNITRGIRVDDPAIDLAVVAAILSSNNDSTLRENYCFAGEVGLSGEVRSVQRLEQRIMEAEKLGFNTIIISKQNKFSLKTKNIKIVKLSNIEELLDYI